jgi:hypothetical protein
MGLAIRRNPAKLGDDDGKICHQANDAARRGKAPETHIQSFKRRRLALIQGGKTEQSSD